MTMLPLDGPELADLVDANHILFAQGVLDAFGHVSVRHPADPGFFLIARTMAPGLVSNDDVVVCGLDGEVRDAAGRRTYLERFIHSEIYAARPDVQAIVHSHAPELIPFGVTGTRLRPVCHMAGFLGAAGTPVFEMRDAMGEPTDLLVRSRAQGAALARTLGDAAVALMRGHGSVAVGTSLRQAVFRAIYAQVNARLQGQAAQLGPIRFLSAEEAGLAAATNDSQLERPWALWRQHAASHGRNPAQAD